MGSSMGDLVQSAGSGCYEASRAAALSGVPVTTVSWWAREGIVVPSVSPSREKFWSYADLMALRVVSWLRHPKVSGAGKPLPASPMPRVRRALVLLEQLGLDPWMSAEPPRSSPLLVDARGEIFVRYEGRVVDVHGRPAALPERYLNLTGPFDLAAQSGPDLVRPRPHLRIVPSKVAGEPHVADSRVTTQTLAAMVHRGLTEPQVAALYELDVAAVREAIDLERQLTSRPAAA